MSEKPFFWSWQDAITESDLKATTRLVLLTLATFMNAKNTAAHPTQEELARCSGLSIRAVKSNLKLAIDAGFLEVSKHGFGGQKWANNQYKAVMPTPSKGSAAGAPDSEKVVQQVPKGSAPNDQKVVQEVHTNNPVNNPIITQTREGAVNQPKQPPEKPLPKERLNTGLEVWEASYTEFIAALGKSKVAVSADAKRFLRVVRLREDKSPKAIGAAVAARCRDEKKNNPDAEKYRKSLATILDDGLFETYFEPDGPKVEFEDGVARMRREEAENEAWIKSQYEKTKETAQ
ncbi:helix-turn-helix domain-containing protein [Litorimonas sp.]|uniref:helix-turn-helix domain-containing protein n=1 Tax=Litorimonas sp. TaxID=1892381 RepID=UPI003A845D60